MKSFSVNTKALILSDKNEKTYGDKTYYYYDCELLGGWRDRVLVRDYDVLVLNSSVDVVVRVSGDGEGGVRPCVYLNRQVR